MSKITYLNSHLYKFRKEPEYKFDLEDVEAYFDDKDFMLEAVKIDAYCLKYASERLKNNKIIVKAAAKSERFADYVFEFIGEDIKKDEIFIKKLKKI